MIAGLASARAVPADLLRELADVVGGAYGLVVAEERPPETADLFIEMCRMAEGPRLVDGALLT